MPRCATAFVDLVQLCGLSKPSDDFGDYLASNILEIWQADV